MKYINKIMFFFRAIAVLIVVFCLYAVVTNKFNLLEKTANYLIPFVIVYFIGSSFQMLMRFKAAGRYKKESEVEEENSNG